MYISMSQLFPNVQWYTAFFVILRRKNPISIVLNKDVKDKFECAAYNRLFTFASFAGERDIVVSRCKISTYQTQFFLSFQDRTFLRFTFPFPLTPYVCSSVTWSTRRIIRWSGSRRLDSSTWYIISTCLRCSGLNLKWRNKWIVITGTRIQIHRDVVTYFKI